MRPKGWMSLALGAAVSFSLTAASADPSNNTKFNGHWNVSMTTDTGVCDRSAAYGIAILDGSIMARARADGVALSGRVDGGGRVEVVLAKGPARAAATGRLLASSGSGTWELPTLGCAGRWNAARS